MTRIAVSVLIAVSLMSSQAIAQNPPSYGPPISLDKAKEVMASAEAEAMRNNWPMVIAILDSGGHLVMLHRLDNAQHGSEIVAQQKAKTAVDFKRSTKLLEDALRMGSLNLRLLALGNVTPVDGGIPLVEQGRIVGAIGASGMQPEQDAQVAKAGADAM